MSELALNSAAQSALINAYTSSKSNELRKAENRVRMATKDVAGELDKAAEDFEAVFLSEMLGAMFKDVGADPVFGGGQSEEMWRSMLIGEYGKIVARTGGIGVADYVKREMLKLQEEHI